MGEKMGEIIIPKAYESILNIRDTEIAIKYLRFFFEESLSTNLNLTRISAPLYVFPETGLNDNLNGIEEPVSFSIKEQNGKCAEIVHSLAKWKRLALKRYGFMYGEGIYTNMNAIRREEITDNIHSLYVDQWDWELVIEKDERNMDTLRSIVNKIYDTILQTEKYVCNKFPDIKSKLPNEIMFISTQELEDTYPNLTPKERENKVARQYRAVCVTQIGGALKSGMIHDGRAPDYDDWSLNCDIILYYPLLDIGLEISSMGIRVDEKTLIAQLSEKGVTEMERLSFHKALLNGELPNTVGGGIGQSRLCMYLLNKAHIGEVQVSVWPSEMETICFENNINLL